MAGRVGGSAPDENTPCGQRLLRIFLVVRPLLLPVPHSSPHGLLGRTRIAVVSRRRSLAHPGGVWVAGCGRRGGLAQRSRGPRRSDELDVSSERSRRSPTTPADFEGPSKTSSCFVTAVLDRSTDDRSISAESRCRFRSSLIVEISVSIIGLACWAIYQSERDKMADPYFRHAKRGRYEDEDGTKWDAAGANFARLTAPFLFQLRV